MTRSLTLELLPGRLAVARLAPDAETPSWAAAGAFVSVTRTRAELSVICDEGAVPEEVRAERGFRALRVAGALGFAEVGVLASLAAPLADGGVPIFVVSTFDTDTLLVAAGDLPRALETLRRAGHAVGEDPEA